MIMEAIFYSSIKGKKLSEATKAKLRNYPGPNKGKKGDYPLLYFWASHALSWLGQVGVLIFFGIAFLGGIVSDGCASERPLPTFDVAHQIEATPSVVRLFSYKITQATIGHPCEENSTTEKRQPDNSQFHMLSLNTAMRMTFSGLLAGISVGGMIGFMFGLKATRKC